MLTHILPLLVFTTLAGTAAGAYAVNAVRLPQKGAQERAWLFPLVCLVLLGVGLLGTLAHLGQPLRFINGMANPASMISQESYWSIAFGVVLVVDLALCKVKGNAIMPLRWVGALVAIGLMVVTGMAYFMSLGLEAWRGAATVPLFVVGDFVLGAALCALFADEGNRRAILVANVVFAAVWTVVLVAFGLYLGTVALDATPQLVVAGILALAGTAVALAALAGKLAEMPTSIALIALALVGVVVARYAFFALGMGA